ncbi:MAG: hypothetical protein KAU31_15545, partial [Spirochaetaceae bacterium]|nr:hypothetical protein [Spirochaetaceae bacterium]
DYAFFSDDYGPGGTGFVVVDINPESPNYLTVYSAINTSGIDTAIDVVGNYGFLASNDTTHSLRLLDASDPTNMDSTSIMESIGWASANPRAVIVRDKYVYVGDLNNGLIIIDALPSE